MTRRPCVLVVLATVSLIALSSPASAQTTEYFGLDGLGFYSDAVDFNQNYEFVGFGEVTPTISGTEYASQGVTIVHRDSLALNVFLPTGGGFFGGDTFSAYVLAGSSPSLGERSDNIDFVFSVPVTAASLWIGNIGPGSTEVQFLAANGSVIASEVFDVTHAGILFTPPPFGGNKIFYGVTTTTPIARIRTIEPGGDGDVVCYDEIEFGQSIAAGSGDHDPPLVDITTPLADAITAGSIFVSAMVSDASPFTVASTPAGVTLDAGGLTASGIVDLGMLADGPHPIAVTATDAFGNVGGDSVMVIKDGTPPVISISSPLPDAVVGVALVTVVVSVSDLTATVVDIQGTLVSVPAGGGTAPADVTLAPGANIISVTATDAAGNSSSATRAVSYDASAPIVMIQTPANGTSFGAGQATVTVGASVDDLSETHVVSAPSGIDAQLPAGGGTVTGMVTLAEGLNTIAVSATDAFGRSGTDFVSVTLDTTGPVVVLESPADGSSIRGTIDLHADAQDPLPGSGVTQVKFFVDGGLYATLGAAPYEVEFDTTTLADGLHAFTAVATDGKGNTGSASATARVDNTPPTVVITDPGNGALVAGDQPFTATAEDAGSGVDTLTMRANGAPPATDGSFDFDPPVASGSRTSVVATQSYPDGSLELTATVKDAAGNQATASIIVTVDNTAPQKMLITPTDGSIVAGLMLIQAVASDPNLASLSLFLNGVLFLTTPTGSISTAVDTTAIPDGPLEVKVVALDLAGNFSTCTATVTVNNMAFKLNPQTLNLKSKGGANSVTAEVTGPNASLLIPTESKAIELRVPGGSPVPSTQGWAGDDSVATGPGGIPLLTIKFDRQALITAIRAGIAGGSIPAAGPVTVTLVSAGRVIGTDTVAIVGH